MCEWICKLSLRVPLHHHDLGNPSAQSPDCWLKGSQLHACPQTAIPFVRNIHKFVTVSLFVPSAKEEAALCQAGQAPAFPSCPFCRTRKQSPLSREVQAGTGAAEAGGWPRSLRHPSSLHRGCCAPAAACVPPDLQVGYGCRSACVVVAGSQA